MAIPRCLGFHKSTNTAPVDIIGAEPKKPLKNLVSNTVCMSLAVAVPKDMAADMKKGASTGHFLP